MTATEEVQIAVEEVRDLTKYKPIDVIAAELLSLPQVEFPLINTFVPGLYIRRRLMPKEVLYVTAIHNEESAFVISKGSVSISTDGTNWTHVSAPFSGVTKPGTQRIIVTFEDTIWETFHPNPENERDVKKLELRLASMPELPPELMDGIGNKQLTVI